VNIYHIPGKIAKTIAKKPIIAPGHGYAEGGAAKNKGQ
jgi:hypothetical protein